MNSTYEHILRLRGLLHLLLLFHLGFSLLWLGNYIAGNKTSSPPSKNHKCQVSFPSPSCRQAENVT